MQREESHDRKETKRSWFSANHTTIPLPDRMLWRFPKLRQTPRQYSTTPPRPSFLSSYISLLRTRYPLADPPSLIASFLILHELTAVVPVFLGFWSLKSLGVGDSMVLWALESEEGWGKDRVREWVKEGEGTAEKVGRRYGVLGYSKEGKEEREERRSRETEVGGGLREVARPEGINVGGDVANLVGAYLLVKVSLWRS